MHCFYLLLTVKDDAVFLCHGHGLKINWQLCWWYLQYICHSNDDPTGEYEVTLCVIHFRRKELTAICASKHAHYMFCIVIQMWVGGFLDIFFTKVGNWSWIIFGLQDIGWLKFNCFNLHLMLHSIDIHWKRNGK